MKVIEAIGQRIQKIIKDKGLSQYAVCKKATVHDSTLYNIFNGNQKHLSVNVLLLLCEGMDISIVEFFDDPLFKNLDID